MPAVACPHCRTPVEDSPGMAGMIVACPSCGKHFTMPAAISIVAPQALQSPPRFNFPQQQQQPLIIVTGQPRQPRLAAGGWFARSFASTSGVILATMLLLFGGVATVCGGCFLITHSAVQGLDLAEKELSRVANQQAKVVLAQHGFTGAISTDTIRTFSLLPGCTDDVSGSVQTDAGVKPFAISFHVATFGKTQHWTPKRVLVDGEEVYAKD